MLASETSCSSFSSYRDKYKENNNFKKNSAREKRKCGICTYALQMKRELDNGCKMTEGGDKNDNAFCS